MVLSRRRALAVGMLFAGGGAIAAAAVAPSGCSHTAAPPATTTQPIVIGVSLGLASSGDLASLAGPMQNGVKVAEAQINAAGGLLGRPVEFRVGDDASSDTTQLQNVIDGFLDAGAVSVLGPISSQQVANVQMKLATHKVLEISASATAIALADAQPPTDRYFFRTAPSDALQGKAVALFASASNAVTANVDSGPGESDGGDDADTGSTVITSGHVACKKMAIVANNDAYGMGLAGAVTTSFAALGGTVVANVSVAPTIIASYASVASQIIAAAPDCLGLFTYDDVGPAVLRDLASARALSPDALAGTFFVVGSDGVFDEGFIQNGRLDPGDPSKGNYTTGVFGTSPDGTPPTAQYNSFLELYNASFPLEAGVLTGQYVSNIYDAAILTVLAIQQAGGISDPVKTRDSLYSVSSGGTSYGPAQVDEALRAIRNGEDIDYDGASGSCDFDSEGNVLGNYIVWQVQNGQFATVSRILEADLK